jgi:hypothetical protein
VREKVCQGFCSRTEVSSGFILRSIFLLVQRDFDIVLFHLQRKTPHFCCLITEDSEMLIITHCELVIVAFFPSILLEKVIGDMLSAVCPSYDTVIFIASGVHM